MATTTRWVSTRAPGLAPEDVVTTTKPMRMTGASGMAEPFKVCVFKIDEFYHLEGRALPTCTVPRAGGGLWGSPRRKNCSAPGSGDAPAASLLYLFILFFSLDDSRKKAPSLGGRQQGERTPLSPSHPPPYCLVSFKHTHQMPNPQCVREAKSGAVLTFDGGESRLLTLLRSEQFLLGYFLINLFLYFFPGQSGSWGLQTHEQRSHLRFILFAAQKEEIYPRTWRRRHTDRNKGQSTGT